MGSDIVTPIAIRGQRPKPYARTRNSRVHHWTEVPDVPNTSGPDLPPRRRNGRKWPAYALAHWQAWSAMPHTIQWRDSDWQYAVDSLELVVRASAEDAPVSLRTELRARERAMGATWDARQSMRVRYVAPCPDGPDASIASIDDYRNL